MSCIKNLDFLGIPYDLTIDGKTNFKTYIGAILSIIIGILSILTIIFFSSDFVFRLNPNIISSLYRLDELNRYTVNNTNFFLSFTAINGFEKSVAKERQYMFPKMTYYFHNNTKGGQNKIIDIPPTPCSTMQTLPDLMANKHYANSTCFDFNDLAARIEEENVPFFGSFESSANSFFTLEMTNCQYDLETKSYHTCLSKAEIDDRGNDFGFFLLRYPKTQLNFDNFEEPLKLQFEEKYFVTTSKLRMNDILRFGHINLADNTGWIFDDFQNYEGNTFLRDSTTFDIINDASFESKNPVVFYYAEFIFSLDEMNAKRTYKKIQEVAANVGGILKILIMIVSSVSKQIAVIERNNVLIKELKTIKRKTRLIANLDSSNIEIRNDEPKVELPSVWDILKALICKRNQRVNYYYEQLKLINSATEVKVLIELCLQGTSSSGNSNNIRFNPIKA